MVIQIKENKTLEKRKNRIYLYKKSKEKLTIDRIMKSKKEKQTLEDKKNRT
jgi:formaldehyde-activating enzyme involved in methanogenesis